MNNQNNWIIGKQIAIGFQGTVSLAKKESDAGYNYVYKVINRQLESNPTARRQLFREAIALRNLDHPDIQKYIASNVDMYLDRDCKLYLVTEYIHGITLYDYVHQNGVIPFEQAIKVTLYLMDIVQYCHTKSIVHRDIRPQNVFVSYEGIEKIALFDFGMSANKFNNGYGSLADAIIQLGNCFLMLFGKEGKVDFRLDINSCCEILFYMLTAIEPTELETNISQKQEALDKAKVMAGNKFDGLYAVFNKAFDRNVSKRFQSISELKSNLHALQSSN